MVLPEPVEEWENVNGTDLLDLMFHNGTRYFGTFQLESSFTRYIIPLFVFNSRNCAECNCFQFLVFRLKQALRIPPLPSQNHGIKKTIRLMERSLFSERYSLMKFSFWVSQYYIFDFTAFYLSYYFFTLDTYF